MEIAAEAPRGHIRHALFDLDGTISLLRDGWQDQMVPMLVEVLEECRTDETREQLEALVVDFVDHLTGRQTIYQMIRLCEEVEQRGGTPEEPLVYKQRYNERLNAAIAARIERLRDGTTEPDDLIVSGARRFLEELGRRGVRCYLASGTDEEFVKNDCRLLGLEDLFDGGVFGAQSDYKRYSKKIVIERILSDFDIEGSQLMIVGDGYVEIENAVEVGAFAFGIHTRENNGYHMNADKRDRLARAGAHLLAPDLTEGKAVLDWLEV